MEDSVAEQPAASPLSDFNILVPVDMASRAQYLLPIALNLVGESTSSQVALIGVTPVDADAHLSDGTSLAQHLDVHEQKRPPMIEVKPYLGRHPPRRSSGMPKREKIQ